MNLPLNNLIRIKILDLARGTNQLWVYRQYLKDQYKYDSKVITRYQEARFGHIFRHHLQKNKAYREFLAENGYRESSHIHPSDIPMVTKDFFRNNPGSHFIKEDVHITKHSGGTTGVPLPVHLSKPAVDNFWPAIWRAFDVYGVQPCDKVMMIAGTSLFNNRSFGRRIYDFVNRFTVLSAFDLSADRLEHAYKYILRHGIRVIYGYTSSILVFLDFLEKNGLRLDLKCIFTTSETFIPAVRRLARLCCNCDVVDTYGANDGGIFGFECAHHNGYHLNFERCFVEIIDNEIICTDLFNTASPFIRYRVGDYTDSDRLITDQCSCGRTLFRIENISGKVNQFIEDVDHVKIHCGFFTQLFKADNLIKQYQVHQKKYKLVVNILHDNVKDEIYFREKYTESIRRRFKMPFEMVFNQPVKRLPNMKTAILIKEV